MGKRLDWLDWKTAKEQEIGLRLAMSCETCLEAAFVRRKRGYEPGARYCRKFSRGRFLLLVFDEHTCPSWQMRWREEAKNG